MRISNYQISPDLTRRSFAISGMNTGEAIWLLWFDDQGQTYDNWIYADCIVDEEVNPASKVIFFAALYDEEMVLLDAQAFGERINLSLIQPASSWAFDGVDLELDGDVGNHTGCCRLRPRSLEANAAGDWLSAYVPFDETSDQSYEGMLRWLDKAYGVEIVGARKCLSISPSIKFGNHSAKISEGHGMIRFPHDAEKFTNLSKFTIDLWWCPSNLTGVYGDIMHCECDINGTGFKQWRLSRVNAQLAFCTTNSGNVENQLGTQGVTLEAGRAYHIRLTYDGTLTDGHCLATISVDGVRYANGTSCKKIPLPTFYNAPSLTLGSRYMNYLSGIAGLDMYPAGQVCAVNDLVIFPGVNLPATYDPPTAPFKPFALLSEPATITFDAGIAGTFDSSTFAVSDPAQCNSVVGGPGWEFRRSVDSGESWSEWMTYADIQSLPDASAITRIIYQARCNSDGVSFWYPLSEARIGFNQTIPPIPLHPYAVVRREPEIIPRF